MTSTLVLDNINFIELTNNEMLIVDGGMGIADVASIAGTVYSTVVGAGALGWLGASAVAVCTGPVVAASAVIVGAISVGYLIYSVSK